MFLIKLLYLPNEPLKRVAKSLVNGGIAELGGIPIKVNHESLG